MRRFSGVFFLVLCISCAKGHLYVQQQWVDENFLASAYVNTPDPRREDPPIGQNIIVDWRFPYSFAKKKPRMMLTVRFWDNTEKVVVYPMQTSGGVKSFFFADVSEDKTNKILTYKVEVVDQEGQVVETWKHHFWTRLIDVDK